MTARLTKHVSRVILTELNDQLSEESVLPNVKLESYSMGTTNFITLTDQDLVLSFRIQESEYEDEPAEVVDIILEDGANPPLAFHYDIEELVKAGEADKLISLYKKLIHDFFHYRWTVCIGTLLKNGIDFYLKSENLY